MCMSDKISVLIVDPFPVVRWAIRAVLERHPTIDVLGETSSATEVISQARHYRPDVVVGEVAVFDSNADDIKSVIAASKRMRLVAFSTQDTWDHVVTFFELGGTGYVSKRSPVKELIEAIKVVASGGQYISPIIRQSKPIPAAHRQKSEYVLSQREKEIVALIVDGLTSNQIADQLSISRRTVETHRYRIYRKLNIRNRAQVVHYAKTNGLIQTNQIEFF